MKENTLTTDFSEYLCAEINDLTLIVSSIKTFLKASDYLLYEEKFSISDIQNMYDELAEKIKLLDEHVENLNNKAFESGIM